MSGVPVEPSAGPRDAGKQGSPGSRATHRIAASRSLAAAPSLTASSTSTMHVRSLDGLRRTSWLSGIWRKSLHRNNGHVIECHSFVSDRLWVGKPASPPSSRLPQWHAPCIHPVLGHVRRDGAAKQLARGGGGGHDARLENDDQRRRSRFPLWMVGINVEVAAPAGRHRFPFAASPVVAIHPSGWHVVLSAPPPGLLTQTRGRFQTCGDTASSACAHCTSTIRHYCTEIELPINLAMHLTSIGLPCTHGAHGCS